MKWLCASSCPKHRKLRVNQKENAGMSKCSNRLKIDGLESIHPHIQDVVLIMPMHDEGNAGNGGISRDEQGLLNADTLPLMN